MIARIVQWWDIIPGKDDEYVTFITEQYMPKLQKMGVEPKGGFYLAVGTGPRVAFVATAESMMAMGKALCSDTYKNLALELKTYVINFSSRIDEPTGRIKNGGYSIQKGVWKYIQYYDLYPGRKKEYADFIVNEYIPGVEALGYVEVTGGWNLVMGSFAEITGELTMKTAVDVGRMLENAKFNQLVDELRKDYVLNYASRILRTTERFDEPRWYTL